MKINPGQTLAEVAAVINAQAIGDPNHLITGINEIHRVEAGDITFVDVEKYFKKALESNATTILINKVIEPPPGKALLVSDDPFRDYNRITQHYQPIQPGYAVGDNSNQQIDPTVKQGLHVSIGTNVTIGAHTQIGHNVVIGNNVTIGENCIIYPNVSIYENTTIGNYVTIQSGAVIGSEAFYFKKRPYGRDKLLSAGRTIIGDWVEIGANTTIDRGVSADTSIGEHTKIDNLCQIGHDTVIGKRCVMAAQVGIAGVSTVEDDVIIWGQVGISSDVVIGKGAVILAKTGVMSSLPGGKVYFGTVAKEYKQKWREVASLEKLPALIQKINQILPDDFNNSGN